MKNNTLIVCAVLSMVALVTWSMVSNKSIVLKEESFLTVPFTEPSDVLVLSDQEWIVPGDKAFLYKVNAQGEKTGTYDVNGFDVEAVCTDGQFIYASEETYQNIKVLDKTTLALLKEIPFHHAGGRNEGVEAMAFIAQNKFVLATEKDPQLLFLCDQDFQVKEQFQVAGISEVSGMTFHEGYLFVLSDEEETIYKVDLSSKSIVQQWQLNVINPEGISFLPNGQVVIACDDMARLYFYKLSN